MVLYKGLPVGLYILSLVKLCQCDVFKKFLARFRPITQLEAVELIPIPFTSSSATICAVYFQKDSVENSRCCIEDEAVYQRRQEPPEDNPASCYASWVSNAGRLDIEPDVAKLRSIDFLARLGG